MLNPLAYLQTWEIAAAAAWTLYCAGSLLSARRAKRERQREADPIFYSFIWLAGFAATFLLLQVVRIPPASTGDQPMVKSTAKEQPSKLSNVASARDEN